MRALCAGSGLWRGRAGVAVAPAKAVLASTRASSGEITDPMVSGGPDKDGSIVPAPRRSGVQAWMRKGAGGRNSFSGIVATIFGAGGFAGKYVAARLGKIGCQLIFPYRSDPYCVRHLKQSGDLGQTLFFPFELTDEDSIRKVVKYSNVVINMIGSFNATPNFSLFDVNGTGAGRLARIAKEMGVEKFIHVSAMNASHTPPERIIPGGSEFLRSKALGEDLVKEAFPGAIIARPANMYGEDGDQFLGTYAHHFRGYLVKKFDVWRRGEETVKMPLFGPNIADGMEKLVLDPTLVGQTVEFVGPYAYTFADLHDYMWKRRFMGEDEMYRRYRRFNGYSPYTQALLTMCDFRAEWGRRKPLYNTELVECIECVTDALTGVPTLTDIGVRNLKVFEITSRSYLDREYTRVGDMEYEFGEAEPPPMPTRVPPVYTKEALAKRPGYTKRRVFDETSLENPASGRPAFA